MSSIDGKIPCLGEITPAPSPPRARAAWLPPACDFAEGRVWQALGGGWTCLYGCYCQYGVSIEWHDFVCAEPRDWARSFHPESVELCLNLSGQARVTCGPETAQFGPMTAGVYCTAGGKVAAWRLPGETHQFLTVEYAPGFLEKHLRGHELALEPVVRSAIHRQAAGRHLSSVYRLNPALRKTIEELRQPPVNGAAQSLWYQSQAMKLMAEFLFAPQTLPDHGSLRQKEVARARVEQVVQILSERLAEPPSLEELGRRVGCSPYHLSRTFSREMGLTIPKYLRQIRMERAAGLLKSGKFNVTEAALEVGYSSLSHFSHAFCETMGCCPGLYPPGGVPAQLRAAPASAPGETASRRQ